jgi:hypothetical protein
MVSRLRETSSVTSSDTGAGRRSAARKISLRNSDIDGEPALFVPRWTAMAKVGRLVLAGITAVCLGGAVASGITAAWGWVLFLVIVGVVVGAFLVRDVRKMPYDGGLWLTPSRLVHRWGGHTWKVSWDDLLDQHVDPATGDVTLVARPQATPEPSPVVSTHLLVISDRAVVMMLGAFAADPPKRAALGTDLALRQAEEIRDVVDRADFQPRVHHAPRPSPALMFSVTLVVIAALLGFAALGRAAG